MPCSRKTAPHSSWYILFVVHPTWSAFSSAFLLMPTFLRFKFQVSLVPSLFLQFALAWSRRVPRKRMNVKMEMQEAVTRKRIKERSWSQFFSHSCHLSIISISLRTMNSSEGVGIVDKAWTAESIKVLFITKGIQQFEPMSDQQCPKQLSQQRRKEKKQNKAASRWRLDWNWELIKELDLIYIAYPSSLCSLPVLMLHSSWVYLERFRSIRVDNNLPRCHRNATTIRSGDGTGLCTQPNGKNGKGKKRNLVSRSRSVSTKNEGWQMQSGGLQCIE